MKNFKSFINVVLIGCILFVLFGAQKRCLDKVEEIVRIDTIEKYSEASNRQSVDIEKHFLNIFNSLDKASRALEEMIIGEEDPFLIAKAVDYANLIDKPLETFYINTEGNVYISNDILINLSGRKYIHDALGGEELFAGPVVIHDTNSVLFIKPISTSKSEVIGCAGYLYAAEDIDKFLSTNSLEEDNYTFLLTKDGVLFSYRSEYLTDKMFNLFFNGNNSNTILINKMPKEKTICEFLEEKNVLYTITPVFKNGSNSNLFVVNLVSGDVIAEKENEASAHIVKMLTITSAMVLLLVVYIFVSTVSKRLKERKVFKEMAFSDLETGGKNFQYFTTELTNSKYIDGYIVAIDLKEFKIFEDFYNPKEVKKLLSGVWTTILKNVPRDSVLAHDQRDQFSLYIKSKTKEELESALERINFALANYSLNNSYPEISAYFGIIEFSRNETASNLYSFAKNSLKDHFTNDENSYHYYQSGLDEYLERKKTVVSYFNYAIENDKFFLEYQPKFSNQSGKVVGAEAFVRLVLEDGRVMYAEDFIKPLEESGLISKLDTYVFRMIVDFIENQQLKNNKVVPISMNISRFTLYQNNIVETFKVYADRKKIDPSFIPLEIGDESLNDDNKGLEVLDLFRESGFEIHIDRFGSTSSSLLTLSEINFDIVKLDKTLIDKIGDFKNEYVLRHIVSLARDLDIQIVAFGVETSIQAKFIEDLGVSLIQGPYYSSPLTSIDFIEILDHYYDVNFRNTEKFKVLRRSDLLSTFASPIFSDSTISEMTGPILELGLKENEIFLLGANPSSAKLLDLDLNHISKSHDLTCFKEYSYDEDYSNIKDIILKVIKRREPESGKALLLKGEQTVLVEYKVFYKREVFGFKEVYCFLTEIKNTLAETDLLNQLPGGFMVYKPNDDQIITNINKELLNIMDCDNEEEFKLLTNNKFSGFVYEQDYRVVITTIFVQFFSSEKNDAKVKFRIKNKNNKIIYVEMHAHYQINDIAGDLVYCYIHSLEGEDEATIEESTRIARLQYDSTHDGLTGLLNQSSVKERVKEILKNNPNTEFAFMVMDIDDFKQVNDKLGHSFGDNVIKTFANSLANCVSRPGICARIGGDEFVAIEPLVKENLTQVAERFYKNMHFTLGEAVISPSIGITTTTLSNREYASMFLSADVALYGSKNAGKDTYTIYEPNTNDKTYRIESGRKDTFNTDRIIETIDKTAEFADSYLFMLDLRANKMHISYKALEKFNIDNVDISSEDLLKNTVFEPDIEMLKEEMAQIRKGEKDDHNIIYRWIDKDHQPIWIKCKGKVIKNLSKPWCLVGGINIIRQK